MLNREEPVIATVEPYAIYQNSSILDNDEVAYYASHEDDSWAEEAAMSDADERMLTGAICLDGLCSTPAEGERYCRKHTCRGLQGGTCNTTRPCEVCGEFLNDPLFSEWLDRRRG